MTSLVDDVDKALASLQKELDACGDIDCEFCAPRKEAMAALQRCRESLAWMDRDAYRKSNHRGLVVFYDSLEPMCSEVRRSDQGHSDRIEPNLIFALPPLPPTEENGE
jgi:hypothetical protein